MDRVPPGIMKAWTIPKFIMDCPGGCNDQATHRMSVYYAICTGCIFVGKPNFASPVPYFVARKLHSIDQIPMQMITLIDYVSFIIGTGLVFDVIGDIKVVLRAQ